KGLQKLRWYCQMCQKQCRDEINLFEHQWCNVSWDHVQVTLYAECYWHKVGLTLDVRYSYKHHRPLVTLTDFTKWLGREGYCTVDETPKGRYIQYINRSLSIVHAVLLHICLSAMIHPGLSLLCVFQMEEQQKKSVRSDNWIQANIVVKKAVITLSDYIDKYTAVVKMIDSGNKLKLDQSHLETVIPAPDRVLILNGQYKDTEVILEGVNEHKFSATGRMKGKTVEGVAYEDFSKLSSYSYQSA
uniref:Kin17 DNA and RNA binding protein n=1 Tax=Cyprinus carpio TaxID=7962 RepID=A0A8C1KQ31_CYPCA